MQLYVSHKETLNHGNAAKQKLEIQQNPVIKQEKRERPAKTTLGFKVSGCSFTFVELTDVGLGRVKLRLPIR